MQLILIAVANEIVEENKLNLSQYAIKQATTMSDLVEKRLIIESAKLTRQDYVWLVSDMTACYDRHIQEIGNILMQTHGIYKE